MPPRCGVCDQHESKYKCTRCRTLRYCSKDCFTLHSESCTGPDPASAAVTTASPAPVSSADLTAATSAAAVASVPVPLRGNTRVTSVAASNAVATSLTQFPDANLARIREDPSLRAALRSGELQVLITAIVSASSDTVQRRLLAEQVEANPRFAEFVHELLGLVDDARVEEAARQQKETDAAVAALLRGEHP